jgi:hypothetical protein
MTIALLRALRGAALGSLMCALAALSVRGAAKEPFAGVDDRWRHYQSPNFELFSRVSDSDSRVVLHDLEVLRSLFLRTLAIEARAPAPVTIYYFSNEKDFRAYLQPSYRKNERYRAHYLPDADRGVMLLAPLDNNQAGNQLALTSYIGHLFHMSGENPPAWFRAGFAHLFETLEVQTERAIYGKPQPGRVHLLQLDKLMPLEALMGIEGDDPLFGNEDATSLFYAQSWAVVHYLTLGQHQLPREGIDRFFRFIRQRHRVGPDERRAAFEQCVGISLEQLNRAIDSYVVSGRYSYSRIPIPELPDRSSYLRRDVPREEIRERLGEVAYRATDDPAGRFALLDVIGRDRTDTRALEALGAVAGRHGERDEMHSRWERAMEAGTDNPAVVRQFAQMESERWFRQFDYYFRLPAERADYLRELLLRSIKVAPLQSDAYEQLAWVESAAPTPSNANVNLVQSKFPTLDDQPRTLLALALVRLRVGDRETADKLLAELDQESSGIRVRQEVERVRAILENRPPRRLEPPAATRAPGVRISPGIRKP